MIPISHGGQGDLGNMKLDMDTSRSERSPFKSQHVEYEHKGVMV